MEIVTGDMGQYDCASMRFDHCIKITTDAGDVSYVGLPTGEALYHARSLLGWSFSRAARDTISKPTLIAWEQAGPEIPNANLVNLGRYIVRLIEAGVEFHPDGGVSTPDGRAWTPPAQRGEGTD